MHAVGEAFDGSFAISDRADGDPLEHVPSEQWRTLVPALCDALAAMRSIEPPPGSGGWTAAGEGACAGWREHLLAVAGDGDDVRHRTEGVALRAGGDRFGHA